ncbi:N-acetyltransferase [Streptomyces spinosirectus]|jgi:predicted GNAT family acetyltransferase|uniref:GNAT family N-acetyltransferase n=1 Tax=Streptomyces TaxID=1883 RepID=UPI001C9E16C1|nr:MULTISPECIES: GNAT family N-acetyltransferase [Streptomyces]MBY8346114.1 N-acetyltransferase [Streptomyces plumbidurans]UIR22702.1 N-acetyltransferase [Streptomyces spinosirectus]
MAEVLFDDSAKRVRVVDEPEYRRYALYLDGAQVGTLSYRVVEQRRVLGHTEVDETCRGRGLSQILVQVILDDLRERRQKATVHCPAVAQFMTRSVKYADVIDPSHPGIWVLGFGGDPAA